MKFKIYLFLSVFVILSFFYSCEKGRCDFKPVGEPFCEQGFDKWEDVKIIKGEYHNSFRKNSPYIIRNQEEYDSLMTDYQPIEIDFEQYSLLGVEIITGWGSRKSSICWLCRKKESNQVIMHVKYSLANQCAGSGISSMYIAYWAQVPKISENTQVDFQVTDVNPYY